MIAVFSEPRQGNHPRLVKFSFCKIYFFSSFFSFYGDCFLYSNISQTVLKVGSRDGQSLMGINRFASIFK